MSLRRAALDREYTVRLGKGGGRWRGSSSTSRGAETQDVEFGTVTRWCPECVVVECDCGESSILAAFSTTYGGCGADLRLYYVS